DGRAQSRPTGGTAPPCIADYILGSAGTPSPTFHATVHGFMGRFTCSWPFAGFHGFNGSVEKRPEPMFHEIDLIGGGAGHGRHLRHGRLLDHVEIKDLIMARVGLLL